MKKSILLPALLLTATLNASAQTPQLVYDINPGTDNSLPLYLTPSGANLFFTAITPAYGQELWVLVYGNSTPTMVADINPGPAYGTPQVSTLQGMTNLGGNIYFSADDGVHGSELWMHVVNGQPQLVADINPGNDGSVPTNIININNRIYMRATTTNYGDELYVYNPGLPPVRYDIYPGVNSSLPSEFTEYNGKVYFNATNALAGTELFVFDPATSQVSVAADIIQGAGSSDPKALLVHDGKLYFTANATGYGRELFRFDGSTATRLTDLVPGSQSGIPSSSVLISYNGSVYFSGGTAVGNYQLYHYSPAANAASIAATIRPSGNCGFNSPYVYSGKLYFAADNGTAGTELWVHDGTNTNMVTDLNPGNNSSGPNNFCEFYGKLYFSANNGTSGYELFSFKDASGIQSVQLKGSVTLSPNPVAGDATLTLLLQVATGCAVAVYDAAGRQVWQRETAGYPAGESRISLPTAALPAGTYFYRLSNGNGLLASGRILKQ